MSRRRIEQSEAKVCSICVDTRLEDTFRDAPPITTACQHPPSVCRQCIETSIMTDLSSRIWDDIRCPECRERLQYEDMERLADPDTLARYHQLSVQHTLSKDEDFVWCVAGCGYGQIHDGGFEEPIVTCLQCGHRACFHHHVAWHENLSCAEYDALQEDPENFRSRFELENEAAEAVEQAADARQAQVDADRAFAQSLEVVGDGVVEEEEENDAAANQLKEEERVSREAMARQSRKRKAEDQARDGVKKKREERRDSRETIARESRKRKAEDQRRDAMKRKREEEKSQAKIAKTTKPCPGCNWAIEKRGGCSHMTCTFARTAPSTQGVKSREIRPAWIIR